MSEPAIDLLPCPFCGDRGSITQIESAAGEGRMIWWVECANGDCGVSFHGHARRVDARNAWNTRPNLKPALAQPPPAEGWNVIKSRQDLPQADGKYLAQYSSGLTVVENFVMDDRVRTYWNERLVAWMPLPKPYHPQETPNE